MDIITFFDSDELTLPKQYSTTSFYEFLENCFQNYLNSIKGLTPGNRIADQIIAEINKIEEICDKILKTIKTHYGGHPAAAFGFINDVFNSNRVHLNSLMSPDGINPYLQHLYKIRIGTNAQFTKREIAHIPFESRHIVAVQRYSIPGLPTLYLGGSSYVCWEELDRPDLNRVHIARFAVNKACKIKVLDFGYRPAIIAAMINHYTLSDIDKYIPVIVANAVFWPIVCACSIKVINPKSPFKPEYLIPQYVLQWISSNSDCDGVRYFSCRINFYPSDIQSISNFAFPTKEFKTSGLCQKLLSKFNFTAPLNYQLAKAAKMPGVGVPSKRLEIEPAIGYTVSYTGSEFDDMESMVEYLDCTQLDNYD